MYERHLNSYYASEVADFLKLKLHGENVTIYHPSSLNNIKDNSLIFANESKNIPFEVIKERKEVLLICSYDIHDDTLCSYLISPSPMLDFVRVVKEFFIGKEPPEIHPTAIIKNMEKIGNNVSIGSHSFIGSHVSIGNNTIIHQNVVIAGDVEIGNDCVIKANSTIGSEGFGFVFDKDTPEHFPQIGGIKIGNNVWIGANSTVENAALNYTIIKDNVKIDDLVQIGHNSIIGENTMITAGSIICGEVSIEDKCWIAPNVCINTEVKIGRNSLLGIGAVVIRDVPPNSVAVGNPARIIRKKRKDEDIPR